MKLVAISHDRMLALSHQLTAFSACLCVNAGKGGEVTFFDIISSVAVVASSIVKSVMNDACVRPCVNAMTKQKENN